MRCGFHCELMLRREYHCCVYHKVPKKCPKVIAKMVLAILASTIVFMK
jgi:hypothetical protein